MFSRTKRDLQIMCHVTRRVFPGLGCSRSHTVEIFFVSRAGHTKADGVGFWKLPGNAFEQSRQRTVIQQPYIARAEYGALDFLSPLVGEQRIGSCAAPLDAKGEGALECAGSVHRRSLCGGARAWQVNGLGFVGALRYACGMTETEQAILDTLLELEDAVARVNTEPKPNLIDVFARLDKLTAALPKGTSPDLLHYLHKKSFEKARLFLQGQDPEQGDCPH